MSGFKILTKCVAILWESPLNLWGNEVRGSLRGSVGEVKFVGAL